MKKHLVIGDWIISKNDRQRHYISSHQLVRILNLSIRECILIDKNNTKVPYEVMMRGIIMDDFNIVTPESSGVYDRTMIKIMSL